MTEAVQELLVLFVFVVVGWTFRPRQPYDAPALPEELEELWMCIDTHTHSTCAVMETIRAGVYESCYNVMQLALSFFSSRCRQCTYSHTDMQAPQILSICCCQSNSAFTIVTPTQTLFFNIPSPSISLTHIRTLNFQWTRGSSGSVWRCRTPTSRRWWWWWYWWRCEWFSICVWASHWYTHTHTPMQRSSACRYVISKSIDFRTWWTCQDVCVSSLATTLSLTHTHTRRV